MTQTLSKPEPLQEAALTVNGMDCASCVAHVRKAAEKTGAVQACDVNLARGRAVVRFNPAKINPDQIAAAISDAGYPSTPERDTDSPAALEEQRLHTHQHDARAWLLRAVAGVLLWFPVEATHWIIRLIYGEHANHGTNWMTWTALITSTIAIIYVGAGFYRSAFKALKRLTSNMDTLIALGASVAYGYSLVALIGFLLHWWVALPELYFMEATGLLALISLGHWLEARARQSAGSAIRELLQLTPATALRLEGQTDRTGRSRLQLAPEFKQVPVAALTVGDQILVRPGDRVPIDGIVVAGPSSVDESLITGESLPITRDKNDPVIGGTQNIDGRLIVRVTKTGSQTALAQIVKLVEQAQASKPQIQKLADQVAAIFVPVVLSIALLTGIGWYIWGSTHHWDSATTWGRIALSVCSVLIIACPCALGLAVPAALMVGTGRGAKKGILIRDIDALQKAEKIDTILLDKTGTITLGKPVVSQIKPLNGLSDDELLRLAASAEQFSEHPIGQAIVRAAQERKLQLVEPSSFTNEPGQGVVATVDGIKLRIGNQEMLRGSSTGIPPAADAKEVTGTTVYIAIEDADSISLAGTIHLTDELKTDSSAALQDLRNLNIRTILLTGDNRAVANAIARQVGIEDVHAEVKPDGKAAVIRDLQDQKLTVAMVGDGVNDAPALAQANLGIAIGSGSDIAKQTSDIVLVGSSLHGISTSLRLSRATMRVIRQNLFFAFFYNVLAIPLAALGVLNPYIAAAAMALSDVTVLGNALRLRWTKID